jgi:aspartate/methionine/tyrosine aminotransferase
MKFTSRVNDLQHEGAYVVLARAQELERQGRKIVHLELGQPDFPTPPNVKEAGMQAILDGHTKYTPAAGMFQLREVIADHAGKQRGITITPQEVIVSPGTKPGLFFPPLALVEPGDEIIYPDPGFPTYSAVAQVTRGILIPIPLKEENSFSFDLNVFDEKINDRTKLIILNSPANPTGGVIPLADLQHIAAKAIQHDAWVLTDDIYARLVYDGINVPSIAAIDGMRERTVIVDGFSKSYAMTGWRLGYMIAPAALADRLELLITHSAGCTAAFTQIAGIEALTGSQDIIAKMVAEYQKRRDRMVELVNAIPGMRAQRPEGAFYVFPNVKSFGLKSSVIAKRLLDEAGVAVLSGTDFGAGGEGYIRLCYATSMEKIEEGVSKMAEWFNTLNR